MRWRWGVGVVPHAHSHTHTHTHTHTHAYAHTHTTHTHHTHTYAHALPWSPNPRYKAQIVRYFLASGAQIVPTSWDRGAGYYPSPRRILFPF